MTRSVIVVDNGETVTGEELGMAATEELDAIAEMAANLTRLREQSGYTYRDIERRVVALLGPEAPTYETLRNYHDGQITTRRMNKLLVLALAVVYGVPVSEISPKLGEEMETVERLLATMRDREKTRRRPRKRRVQASRCTPVRPGQPPQERAPRAA